MEWCLFRQPVVSAHALCRVGRVRMRASSRASGLLGSSVFVRPALQLYKLAFYVTFRVSRGGQPLAARASPLVKSPARLPSRWCLASRWPSMPWDALSPRPHRRCRRLPRAKINTPLFSCACVCVFMCEM